MNDFLFGEHRNFLNDSEKPFHFDVEITEDGHGEYNADIGEVTYEELKEIYESGREIIARGIVDFGIGEILGSIPLTMSVTLPPPYETPTLFFSAIATVEEDEISVYILGITAEAVEFAINTYKMGGSSLPDVTGADNGKLLGVSGGEWALVDNKFIVMLTSEIVDTTVVWSADKSITDIITAISIGADVVAQTLEADGMTLELHLIGYESPNVVVFSATADGNELTFFGTYDGDEDSWIRHETGFLTDSDVFDVTYTIALDSETHLPVVSEKSATFAQIQTAINAGKTIIAKFAGIFNGQTASMANIAEGNSSTYEFVLPVYVNSSATYYYVMHADTDDTEAGYGT